MKPHRSFSIGKRNRIRVYINQNNSQNILLRTQTAAIERDAIFLVLKIATAIPVRRKSVLPFSYCSLNVVT